MAIIHRAELTPGKKDLVSAWLPGRPWAAGHEDAVPFGAYRFDDPAGQVGIEGHLLRADAGGPVLHVLLTYRAEPLAGAEPFLVGTTEHSVLGTRWVYDGAGDPVAVAAVAGAVLAGVEQAVEEVLSPEGPVPREPTARVAGGGSASVTLPAVGALDVVDEGLSTTIRTDGLEVTLVRVVGAFAGAGGTLRGTWEGGTGVIAEARTLP